LSYFLPDDYWKGKEKPRHDNRPRNFVTGSPIEEIPVRPESRQHAPRQTRGKPITTDYAQTAKDLVRIGKAIHHSVKSHRGGNKYLHEPRDYQQILDKAAKIKEMEKKAEHYHKARSEIEDFESRRMEYESKQPKKSVFGRLFGR